MSRYLDCWISVAQALFAQALAGAPELVEALPKPLGEGSFGYAARLGGELEGHFGVVLDASILEAPLLGEGVEQKDAWGELLREVADAAAGDLLPKAGKKCRVEKFEPIAAESSISAAFQLKSGEKTWTVLVRDDVRAAKQEAPPPIPSAAAPPPGAPVAASSAAAALSALSPGFELLLDVELEASLRFGCREMPLGEMLELGPGDVVQLDRHVADPVDLIVGDKIVARGEVVLVNGNFGLRVTEVAEPRKRLESIRCLF